MTSTTFGAKKASCFKNPQYLLLWALLLLSALVMLVLVACGEQFFVPARVAVVADLVPAQQHLQAYGSLQQARYFAQILGPSLAGLLYSVLGPTWAFVLNACSFLLSCLFTFLLRTRAQEKRAVQGQRMGLWQEFSQGLHFFVGNRVLVTMLVSGMLFMCGGMAYNSFEYLYGVENLHIPGALLGVYVACYGAGVVVGLPAAAALAKRSSEVDVLWLFLASFGTVMLVLSRVSTMVPGMTCSVLLGFFSSSIFVTVRPLTVLVTPRELIGRVMAFEVPLITVASLLGGLIASLLASTVLAGFHAQFAGMTLGRLDTIFVGVGLLTISAAVFARLTLYRAVKALRAQKAAQLAAVERGAT